MPQATPPARRNAEQDSGVGLFEPGYWAGGAAKRPPRGRQEVAGRGQWGKIEPGGRGGEKGRRNQTPTTGIFRMIPAINKNHSTGFHLTLAHFVLYLL